MEARLLAMTRRCNIAAAFICAVLLALCGASTAGAHTAQILIQSSTLVYQQIPGISVDRNNQVTISEASDESGSYYVVEDPQSTGAFFPAQCAPLNTEDTSVRCPATGIAAIYVRTGNAAKAEHARTSSIVIAAPTPTTLSGGSATVDAGTSNVTAGPVAGNVIYGSLGGGTLAAKNGFVDFIHTCPPANAVEADLEDILIPDCAVIPEPPGTPPPKPKPGAPAPTPSEPGPTGKPPVEAPAASSSVVAITFKQPQPVLRRRYLQLTISVAMALTIRIHASIAVPGIHRPLALAGRVVRLGGAGATATLRLRLPRREVAALRRALSGHRRLYASVQVEAASSATASSFSLARSIRLIH